MNARASLKEHAEQVLRFQLAPINQFLEDSAVQEVMVNAPDDIWIERSGSYLPAGITIPTDALTSAVTTLANINDKSTTSVLDCRLPGLRIAATLPPISVRGPSMSVRRHAARVFSLEDYVEAGAFAPRRKVGGSAAGEARPADSTVEAGDRGLSDFLRWAVHARHNLIVAGSTSSGKTTLLNAIAAEIPRRYRVGTIEDTAELRIVVPNYFSFEANAAAGVDMRALVRHTLRYRPDRVIVGEIRGAEAFDMLDAYNTGHPGSAVSFHSDSAEMALSRLENMVRMAPEASNWPLVDLRRQIASTFRFVIHASTVDGQRGPNEVLEILGIQDGTYRLRSLFRRTNVYV